MDATAWVLLLQKEIPGVSVRLMLLCFLGILLYSLWHKHAQPFLQNELVEQDQTLKKLANSSAHLHHLIIKQEQENTEKKRQLLAIKETFLAWHQRRISATTAAFLATENETLEYKARMEQKERAIQQQQQKSAELHLIIHQLQSNAQKNYQGEAGAQRLIEILEDLERKGS